MIISSFTIFGWCVWMISATAFVTRPNPYLQLAVMISGFWLLALTILKFIAAISRVRRSGPKGFIVPLISVLILVTAPLLGYGLRSVIFKFNLARYEAAAKWVEEQPFKDGSTYVNLFPPSQFSDLAMAIHAKRSNDCGTVVWFFWGRGFPVKHTVRVFSAIDSVVNPDCLGDWKPARKLTEHWYETSD